ncbi:MAG: hypothetical protein H6Q90_740 [Deltaproteobacteria bacterium]|nr:hypothetical protein [Deltaproteobacteria bacterium]
MRVFLAVAVLTACGPSDRGQPAADGPAQPDASAIDAPPSVDTSRVYAHSGLMLYRLDNLTLAATPIGPMTGLDTNQNLLDLAVNKDDALFGITRDKLYSLSATTGAATLVKDLSANSRGFTSLSFAPDADPSNPDILVTANDQGDVFQIDVTGNQAVATQIGSYGTDSTLGKIVSSGDLIAVRGFGVYATVDVGSGTLDYLAKLDPANNWKATLIGPTGFDKIFGLGFWGGKIYGFVDDGFDAGTGDVIELDPDTGAGLSLGQANIRWFGAGVSTNAPIIL